MKHKRLSFSRYGYWKVSGSLLLILIGLVVTSCGNTGPRKPEGKWEVVTLDGDISQRLAQSLPTKVGGTIEFLRKGTIMVANAAAINYGAMPYSYSFPDATHLQIEQTGSQPEVIEYSLLDDVLSMNDGIIRMTLKPYRELDPTPANLVGTWTLPHDSDGNQDDSVTIRGPLSDLMGILGAAMGAEQTEPKERCLVTNHGEGPLGGGVVSYSPTFLSFGADQTLVMGNRFETQWKGTFDARNNYLYITAQMSPEVSDDDPFALIDAACQVAQLTNARLVLGRSDNVLIEYVRASLVPEPVVPDIPSPTIAQLAPSPNTMQGYWMVGQGGYGGLVLSADGTAEISGWGLGSSAVGVYSYPATYHITDGQLFITIDEISSTSSLPQPSIMNMVFTIAGLTSESLTLQGDQIETAFEIAPPLILHRPF